MNGKCKPNLMVGHGSKLQVLIANSTGPKVYQSRYLISILGDMYNMLVKKPKKLQNTNDSAIYRI